MTDTIPIRDCIMDDQTRRHLEATGEIGAPDIDAAISDALADGLAQAGSAYASLADILRAAHDQAATGKGRSRHSDGKPFTEQPIMEIARMLDGIGGHAFQIMKKAQEAARMVRREQHAAAEQELFGVINYAAAAILLIREQ